MHSGAHLIGGDWREGSGPGLDSIDPCTAEVIWRGNAAVESDVAAAIDAAREGFAGWAGQSFDARRAIAEAFAQTLEARADHLTETISRETGKPLWESATEVRSMIGKIAISVRAYQERTGERASDAPAGRAVLRHRPHGVLAVFGPFNFPGHLPNGHIVPALIAGNVVVLKPSELTPLVAEEMVRCWVDSGLPAGVLNLVQGGRDTGVALTGHAGIDGVLFTGSAAVGKSLHGQLGGQPDKILALEMGGNNPLIVAAVADTAAAVHHTLQSAFVTAGQRCTCARRLIVIDGTGARAFTDRLVEATRALRVGRPGDEPPPFLGPVIDNAAAERLLDARASLVAAGAIELVEMQRLERDRPLLRPGLLDVTDVDDRRDEELFGPLLQIVRAPDLDAAIAEANDTRFGLAGGVLADDRAVYERYLARARAGIVNWNTPLTGASSAAPFGGIGDSGNHRPSAYYAADYCAYPVASLESDALAVPETPSPGLTVR